MVRRDMREKLLSVLAEPGTGAALELRNAKGSNGRIEEGELVSSATGKVYPIVRGIPRFVEGETYAETFGMQRNAYRDFQLDSSTGATHARDRFDAETHWDEETLRGKWTLDAGCGAGRFSFSIYARQPWTKLNAKYLLRPVTKRLPPKLLRAGIEAVMPVAFPVTEVLFKLPVVGKVAKFTIPIANYNRGDFTYEQRYREAILDTFDMLAPAFDSPMTAAEVENELRAVGAASWQIQTRVPVNVIGAR